MENKIKNKMIHLGGKEVEWFTPKFIIEYSRTVMGSIDTDPASCHDAQNYIKAKQFYTKETNGLIHNWYGTVFLNPPFTMNKQFIEKLIKEINQNRVEQAILLTHNCTEVKWWHNALNNASSLCILNKRLAFICGTDMKSKTANRGQTIMYFGDRIEKFYEIFSNIGRIFHL
jgi:ParB family chromosome partitioning protein